MTLAGQTPGFTGADLANLVNEAALLAARKGKRVIDQHELEEGIMRVIAGPEKKSRLLTEKERVVTAYHEMGHALVGHFLPDADPVHKISVVSPRPGAWLHDLDAHRGQVPHHPRPARGPDGHDPRRPGGRGAGLRRDHHRRRQRPGEGHLHRQADDDALWHVRQAGPARARPQPGRTLSRARHALRARLLGRSRPHDRRRDPAHHRGGPPARARHPGGAPHRPGEPLPDPPAPRDHRARRVPGDPRRRARGRGLCRARRQGRRARPLTWTPRPSRPPLPSAFPTPRPESPCPRGRRGARAG